MHKLRIFDNLSKEKVELEIEKGKSVNIYLCGPTVYDHVHIGNMRGVLVFDVIHRFLSSLEAEVNYVHNITDIDDKIIEKSHKIGKSEREISQNYAKKYLDNLINYNILFPKFIPKVTNFLSEIKNFIGLLLKNGFAYKNKDSEIIFSIDKAYEDYGKLSGQIIDNLKSKRKLIETDKKNSLDFTLWKKTNKGMKWKSDWCEGRPGWHTECVTFIQKIFGGKSIDIHGGGNDLMFPHHENERIQFKSLNKKELSRVWIHFSHIYYEEEKMSKSLGNFITARSFLKKASANCLRYIVLNSQYNQVINFSENLIEQAKNWESKVENIMRSISFFLYKKNIPLPNNVLLFSETIIGFLLDNVNTVKTIGYLNQIMHRINLSIKRDKIDELKEDSKELLFGLRVMGFDFKIKNYNFKEKKLILTWENSRKEGDYLTSDRIRKELQSESLKILPTQAQ